MKAKCKDCGETEWLLEKNEKRYYYAVVSGHCRTTNNKQTDKWKLN